MRTTTAILTAATLVATAVDAATPIAAFGLKPRRKPPSQPSKQEQKRRDAIIPPPPPPEVQLEEDKSIFPIESNDDGLDLPNPISPNVWNSVTSTLLGVAAKFAPKDTKKNLEPRAARIKVNRLPPNSIKVDLDEVPVVGKALSGTYAKVQKLPKDAEPSVVISLPKDPVAALDGAVNKGNLQFGLNGLLDSVLDVQLEPNRPGLAPVEFKSALIPKWPFAKSKNRSPWHKVSNMGNGEVYYFNELSGETRLEEPKRI